MTVEGFALSVIREVGGGLAAVVIVAEAALIYWLVKHWRASMEARISEQHDNMQTLREIQTETVTALQQMTLTVQELRRELSR